MNLKRTFGALLTLLGIAGLLYAAYIFLNGADQDRNLRALAIYGILGIIFFFSGISLVRNTKDEA